VNVGITCASPQVLHSVFPSPVCVPSAPLDFVFGSSFSLFLIIWSLDEKDMCVVVLYIIGY
jgi:hypothetical protein